MKKMDYTVEGTAARHTFTPISERAKLRTPEPVTFTDAASARENLKAAQKNGFTFSGAHLVDSEQKPVKYGYFVVQNDGTLNPVGQDWGPPDSVYEIGDAMLGGPKNGKEAIIEKIVTGDFANKMGFGVVFIIKERDVSTSN